LLQAATSDQALAVAVALHLEKAGVDFQKTGKNIGVGINVRKLPKQKGQNG